MAIMVNKANAKKVHSYIPFSERIGVDLPTTFELKTLSYSELTQLDDILTTMVAGKEVRLAAGSYNRLAIKLSLCGIKNFVDETNNAIPFETGIDGKVSDNFLDLIPFDVKTELANYIVSASKYPVTDRNFLQNP